MRYNDLQIGMIVRAWTSTHGTYLIRVVDFTKGESRMTRVIGDVIEMLEPPFMNRRRYKNLEQINVGINCVSLDSKSPTQHSNIFKKRTVRR